MRELTPAERRLLDAMLKDPDLFDRLLGDEDVLVRVSPWFFFAVLLRRAAGLLRISHFIHLRAEICSETLLEEMAAFGPQDRVGIVSLMDHTPGQRQFRDLNALKNYVGKKRGMNDADLFADSILSNTGATYWDTASPLSVGYSENSSSIIRVFLQ